MKRKLSVQILSFVMVMCFLLMQSSFASTPTEVDKSGPSDQQVTQKTDVVEEVTSKPQDDEDSNAAHFKEEIFESIGAMKEKISKLEVAENLYAAYPADIVSDVKQFGAIGDGVTDDTQAIKAAIATGRTVFFSKGVYKVTEELLITSESQLLYGEGAGTGHEDGVLGFQDNTTLLFCGTGTKSVKTRVLHRSSASDPEDAPISTAINIQAGSVKIRDLCVRLNFTGDTTSPTNYGDDWDAGIFVGCRTRINLTNVIVIGYWRKASIYVDVTHAVNLPHYNNYPSSPSDNGADGMTLTGVVTYGGLWGVYVQGSKLKSGSTDQTPQYYDSVSGQLFGDYRGSLGCSDLLSISCSFFGFQHHTKYRKADYTGNVTADLAGGGSVYIDGYCMNDVGRIRGHEFINTRFQTNCPIMIYLGRTRRDIFISCFWDINGSFKKTDGTLVTSRVIGQDYYGCIAGSTERQMTKIVASSNSPHASYFHYGPNDVMVGNDTADGINIMDSNFKMGNLNNKYLMQFLTNKPDGFTITSSSDGTNPDFKIDFKPDSHMMYLYMLNSTNTFGEFLRMWHSATSTFLVAPNKNFILQGNSFNFSGATGTSLAQIFASGNMTLPLGSLTLPTANTGIILTSPNGTKYKVTVDNAGNLISTLQP